MALKTGITSHPSDWKGPGHLSMPWPHCGYLVGSAHTRTRREAIPGRDYPLPGPCPECISRLADQAPAAALTAVSRAGA